LILNFHSDWDKILKNEISKDYFIKLIHLLDIEYKKYQCFPQKNEIFNAFKYCEFSQIKVVIIGQDPFHKTGQANGLAFSVNKNCNLPPSLKNIFKEINSDTGVFRNNGDLSYLSKQGVLLLNTSLTVRENHPGSHTGLDWNIFTDKIINEISMFSTKK